MQKEKVMEKHQEIMDQGIMKSILDLEKTLWVDGTLKKDTTYENLHKKGNGRGQRTKR